MPFFRYLQYVDYIQDFFEFRLPEISFAFDTHRKQLLMVTLYIVFKKALIWTNFPSGWVQCALLLFRSISEPCITESELSELLSHEEVPKWCKMSVMRTFKDSFGDIRSVFYEPRKLKHLCRCHIRKRLNDDFQLPSGIYSLGLPQGLVSYLRLEF